MMTSINPQRQTRYPRILTTTMMMAGLAISPPIHHHLLTVSSISPITLTSGSTLWDSTSSAEQITKQLHGLSLKTSPQDHFLGSWTIVKAQTHLEQLGSASVVHSDEDLNQQTLGSMSAQPITAIPLQQISTPEQNFAEEATIITSVVGGNTIIETWTPLVVNGTPENVSVPAVSGITVIPESVSPVTTVPEAESPTVDEPTAAGEGTTIVHEVPLSEVPEAHSPEIPVPAHEIIPSQSEGLGLDFSLFSLVTNLFEDVIDIDEVLFGDLFRVGTDLVEDMVTGLGDAIADWWDLNSAILSGLFAPRAVIFPLLADQEGYLSEERNILAANPDQDSFSRVFADHLSYTDLTAMENSDLWEEPALEPSFDHDEDIPNLDID